MADVLPRPIYLITDGARLRNAGKLVFAIEQALIGAEGAIGYVQLREQVVVRSEPLEDSKIANAGVANFCSATSVATDREVLQLAEKLLPLCHRFDSRLIINGRPDLAKVSGADGVHLGQNSLQVEQVQEFLGFEAFIGYSAHSVEEALFQLKKKVTYVFLSPIFQPISKPDRIDVLGLSKLQELTQATTGVVFALGGITKENVMLCRQAGASGVAVISGVLGAESPLLAARALRECWAKFPVPGGKIF